MSDEENEVEIVEQEEQKEKEEFVIVEDLTGLPF